MSLKRLTEMFQLCDVYTALRSDWYIGSYIVHSAHLYQTIHNINDICLLFQNTFCYVSKTVRVKYFKHFIYKKKDFSIAPV